MVAAGKGIRPISQWSCDRGISAASTYKEALTQWESEISVGEPASSAFRFVSE